MIGSHPRVVLAYHGTDPATAERILRGELPVADWRPSTNVYDWLGHGIYFWEYGPERARGWAKKGGVVGALISLGTCLDLTDVAHTELLAEMYQTFAAQQRKHHKAVPTNRGKLHDLDCAVINYAARDARMKGQAIQTVRGAFLEGDPVFPGSSIHRQTHIRIAVRDRSCIIGLFRPT
jgi:hypothetical protein